MKTLLAVMAVCKADFTIAAERAGWLIKLEQPSDTDLLIVNDGSLSEEQVTLLTTCYAQSFRSVFTKTIGDMPQGLKWPESVNYVFRYIARELWYDKHWIEQELYNGWFYFEPDVTPLHKDWLGILNKQYEFGKKPFMGVKSTVQATSAKGQKMTIEHMTGAGVYSFLAQHYSENMMLMDGIPWDVAGLCAADSHKIYYIPESAYLHVFNSTNYKIMDGNYVGQKKDMNGMTSEIKEPIAQHILHHGCKDGSLMRALGGVSSSIEVPKKEKKIKYMQSFTLPIDDIIADKKSGMSWHNLLRKYKVSPVSLKAILAGA